MPSLPPCCVVQARQFQLDDHAVLRAFLPVCRAVQAMHSLSPALAHRWVLWRALACMVRQAFTLAEKRGFYHASNCVLQLMDGRPEPWRACAGCWAPD